MPMRTNYVLIDFENVQPEFLETLNHENFQVYVFVGAKQNVPSDFAAALQPLGSRAEYVKISGQGNNALDFHIAFYIGHLAAQNPDSCFHIISKDTGFDPLIEFLKEKKEIPARRVNAVKKIPLVGNASTPSKERLDQVIKRLLSMKTGKPGTIKALNNCIQSVFLNQLSEEEVTSLRKALTDKRYISFQGTKVSYALPKAAAS